jgi:hypothetical protein
VPTPKHVSSTHLGEQKRFKVGIDFPQQLTPERVFMRGFSFGFLNLLASAFMNILFLRISYCFGIDNLGHENVPVHKYTNRNLSVKS